MSVSETIAGVHNLIREDPLNHTFHRNKVMQRWKSYDESYLYLELPLLTVTLLKDRHAG